MTQMVQNSSLDTLKKRIIWENRLIRGVFAAIRLPFSLRYIVYYHYVESEERLDREIAINYPRSLWFVGYDDMLFARDTLLSYTTSPQRHAICCTRLVYHL